MRYMATADFIKKIRNALNKSYRFWQALQKKYPCMTRAVLINWRLAGRVSYTLQTLKVLQKLVCHFKKQNTSKSN